MDGVSSYILQLVASAIICGGLQALFGKGGGISSLIRTICGIYMAFVLLSPLKNVDFSIYTDYFYNFSEQAQAVVDSGEEMAANALRQSIKEKTEAYILEKAISLGADVSVEVTLSADTLPKPSQITVKGAVSPYVKRVLSQYMEQQLGIPEEAQYWT